MASLEALHRSLIFEPQRHLDASHIPAICPPELWATMIESPRVQGRLAQAVAKHFDFDFTLTPPPIAAIHRVVLMPAAVIQELCSLAGVAITAEQMRTIIDRDRVAALKAAIGDNRHAFAMNRAELITQLHDPAPLPGVTDGDGSAGLDKTVFARGFALLNIALGKLPPGYEKRLHLKLPANALDKLSEQPALDVEPDIAVQTIRRLIRQEFPEWYAIFS